MRSFSFLFSLLVFVKYSVLALIFVIKISSFLILEFVSNTTKYYLNNMTFCGAKGHSTYSTCTEKQSLVLNLLDRGVWMIIGWGLTEILQILQACVKI